MERSCFLIGHRDASSDIAGALEEAIWDHIRTKGVREFYVGNHGRFDAMAISILRRVRAAEPSVRVYLSLAYHPSIRPCEIPEGFDGSYYPEGMETVPPRYAISRLDAHMVRRCDCLIACVTRQYGGAYAVLRRARAREKAGEMTVVNLAEESGL